MAIVVFGINIHYFCRSEKSMGWTPEQALVKVPREELEQIAAKIRAEGINVTVS